MSATLQARLLNLKLILSSMEGVPWYINYGGMATATRRRIGRNSCRQN